MPWYKFTGPILPLEAPDPFDPTQYTHVGDTPPPVLLSSSTMYAIQSIDDNGKPVITTALHWEIIEAIINLSSSTNVLLRF